MSEFTKVQIEQSFIPISAARPGRKLNSFKGVTIHETANYRRDADARVHGKYMQGGGKNNQVSSHYYVDDVRVVYTIPESEVAWHAGDGLRAEGGNLNTIAIEICENWGYLPPEYTGMQQGVKPVSQASTQEKADAMARFSKTVDNAAQLTAEILHRHGKTNAEGWVFQHNHWSRKDCPHNIRKDLPVGWNTFKAKVQVRLDALFNKPSAPEIDKEAEKLPPDTLYRVQVGAFSNKENAEKLLAQLKQDGYTGVIK